MKTKTKLRKLMTYVLTLVMLMTFVPGFTLTSDAADANGVTGDCTWTFAESTGTLTISGEGAMADYATAEDAPWYTYKDSIAEVKIEDGVTSISAYAFYGYPALATVNIAGSVTAFGTGAFQSCPILQNVRYWGKAEPVSADGSHTFSACSSLFAVHVPTDYLDGDSFLGKNLRKELVPAATSYTATVVNGTGSGDFTEGEDVIIMADEIDGKRFVCWTSEDGVAFFMYNEPNTRFTMPAKDVTVTATYEDISTSVQVVLEVTKSVNNWDVEDSFTFNLEAITAGAPMPANTGAVSSEDAPTAYFEAITYEAAGTYEYTITEVQGSTPGMSYDTAPHTVLVTVIADADNNLSALVTYDGEDELIITNTYTPPTVSANVSAVDITSGFALEGAEIQLVDDRGNVIDTKFTTTDDEDTDGVDESICTFTGLTVGKTYSLHTLTAPPGYSVPDNIVIDLSSSGNPDITRTILIEFTMTRVAVSAVDINDRSGIDGVTFWIMDQFGMVVEEWDSVAEAQEITGLLTDETYILHTKETADGYLAPDDILFSINERGVINCSGPLDIDNTIMVEFSPAIYRTVTYHANDGTDRTITESVLDGYDFTPDENALSYLNCELVYWNTEADGSGIFYMPGEAIEDVSEDIDLYAFWELPLNEMDSFENDVCSWSGNDSGLNTFSLKDGAVLYASIILSAENSDEESTITVDGDCVIKGDVSFDGIERTILTVKGNGSLKCDGVLPTSSGNRLKVETDTTVESDLNLGASGGMDSNIAINDATLTVNSGGVILLNYLTMEDGAKLIIHNGRMSFHSYAEIDMDNDSEIHIEGNGFGCVLYKENGDNTAFDELIRGNWLPSGYYFVDENYGYYLYDGENNLATDSIIIKKTQSTPRPSGGGGSSRYTVKFEAFGGSDVNSQTITRNGKVEKPEDPEKDGAVFEGWYSDIAMTESYDFDEKVTKNMTLYAKWKETKENVASGHDCPSLKFTDLDVNQWYHADTDYVLDKDIFKGATDTTFEPNGFITRAMMITVLYRAEGEPEVSGEATFKDTDPGEYYAKAVIWGQQNGIIKGYSDEVYAPQQNIIREQIAAIMFRYAVYKGMDAVTLEENLHFDDAGEISEYAIPAMNWAVGRGILRGKTESTLNPHDYATRVEIAAILHRFLES